MSVFDFCHCGRAECHMHLGGGLQSVCTKDLEGTQATVPLYVAGEWFGQVTCRAIWVCPRWSVSSLHFDSRAIKIQLCVQKKKNVNCVQKKKNVNTSWYIKFRLILTLKQNSRSNSDVFRTKYEVVLCSPYTHTVCFLCT